MALHIQVKFNNLCKLYKLELNDLPINSVIHPKLYALHHVVSVIVNAYAKNAKIGKTQGK